MICRQCKNDYPEKYFEKANTINGKVYRRRKCKYCKKSIQDKRKQSIRDFVEEYKRTRGCQHCGYNDPRALQFHHIDRTNKLFEVGRLTRGGYKAEHIINEMSKCIVLCANCHIILHYEESRKNLGVAQSV